MPKPGREYLFCYQWNILRVRRSVENVIVNFETSPTSAQDDRQSCESPLSAIIRVAISPAPRERNAFHLPLAKRFIALGNTAAGHEVRRGHTRPKCGLSCMQMPGSGSSAVWHAYCLCSSRGILGERDTPQLKWVLAEHLRSSGSGALHPIPSRGVGIETNRPGAGRANLAIADHFSRAESGKSFFLKARKAI